MSREIKFRVWDGKMHEVRGPITLTFFNDPTRIAWALYGIGGAKICDSQYGAVLMQYTGLKDMEGREIYEGDVLFHSGPVTFENGSFVVNGHEPLGEMDPARQLIIGNVHENPELLK